MILLTSTSDLIQLVTGATATIDVHASWVDILSGTVTPGRTNTASISTAATTTVVGNPAASTARNVKFLSVRNRHATTACAVTLQHTDGTNVEQLMSTTLQAGEALIYYDGAFQQFLNSGAPKTSDSTNVSITGGSITGTNITTKAGTTAAAGFTFASGTLETTPQAGDWEYDGLAAYFSPIAGERGVILGESFIFQQGGTRTLTSQTAAQKIFGTPTNGALTVGGSRSYHFEGYVTLSSLSSTSGSFGFALGGTATFTFIEWMSTANKAALATAASAQQTVNQNSTANTAIATATTTTTGWFYVYGFMRISAGGTIIPEVSLGIAAAAIVGQDSFFRVWPVGNNAITSVGNWS